jgi:hypothetical protein
MPLHMDAKSAAAYGVTAGECTIKGMKREVDGTVSRNCAPGEESKWLLTID